jgi:uncharacterized membrane protein YeaQ/YmgE (transglycosylase-associated protein family)
MSVLGWIVLGLTTGAIAKFLMPGKDPGGLIATVLIGIAGAMIGGWAGTRLGYGTVTGFDVRSLALSIGGAIVLLIVYRIVRRR